MPVHARPASKTPAASPARAVAVPASPTAAPFRGARRAWDPALLREPPRPGGRPVTQRVIGHNGKEYHGSIKRPHWGSQSESSLLQQLNEREGTSYTKTKGSMAKHKLDRAHIVSFDNIQEWIVSHLNKPSGSFSDDIGTLIAQCSESERKNATAALKALHDATNAKSSDPKTVVAAANKLLHQLNSASANLRPASKYINAYVGANLDPRLLRTDSGKLQADPHTKAMLGRGYGKIRKALRTPDHGKRIVTSEGPASLSDMSPITQSLLEKAPSEKRKIHSDKLRAAMAQPSRHPYARQAPRKRLNLAPTPSTSTAPTAPSLTKSPASSQSHVQKPPPTSAPTSAPSLPFLPFLPSLPAFSYPPLPLPPMPLLPPQWWLNFSSPSLSAPAPFSFGTTPSPSAHSPGPSSFAPPNASAFSHSPPKLPAPPTSYVPFNYSTYSPSPSMPPSTNLSASSYSPPKLPPPPTSHFPSSYPTYSLPPSLPFSTNPSASSYSPPAPQHSTSQSLPISAQKPAESKPSLSLSTSTAKSPAPTAPPSLTLLRPPAPDLHHQLRMQRHREWLRAQARSKKSTAPSQASAQAPGPI